MVFLCTPRRTLFLISLMTLVYVAYLVSILGQPTKTQVSTWVLGEKQGEGRLSTSSKFGLLSRDVAIIACYRDREIHLKIFINYMNSFLLSQNTSARIYVIEQGGKDPFNRAKLFNVGYVEAKKDHNYTCFIFHDIDLIPQNPKLKYHCGEEPVHLSACIDKFDYRLPYQRYFGGVSAITEQQLKKVNGFSNNYWGWGGEDDDLAARVLKENYKINRPPANLARYIMLRFTGIHTQGIHNPNRFGQLKNAAAKMAEDGLSNLDYELKNKVKYNTYIWILADLKYNGKLTTPHGRITTHKTGSIQRKGKPKAKYQNSKSNNVKETRNQSNTSGDQEARMSSKSRKIK